jgi:Tol biopolymer transport system component
VAPSGDRLVFSRDRFDTDIVRLAPDGGQSAFLGSSFFVGAADFSPDGRRIAFESARLANRPEIWLAASDGSGVERLTHGPGSWQGSPRWSPEGNRIAFDSRGEDGHWDVWTISADGGPPRRLTQHPGDENVPSWSRDGRWVCFSSERSGTRQIWRIPAEGGTAEQVTKNGAGWIALESLEGRVLFFTTAGNRSPLAALALADGTERVVLGCVASYRPSFAVVSEGLYYVDCTPDAPRLRRLDVSSGRDEVPGTLEGHYSTLAVSPDGQTVLYPKVVSDEADIMLIENFR